MRFIKLLFALLLIQFHSGWSLSSSPERSQQFTRTKGPIKTNVDKELILAVSEAIALRVRPEKIETFVGIRATINTTRKTERNTYRLTRIHTYDQNRKRVNIRPTAAEVVYWVLPEHREDSEIVGVAWDSKGRSSLFFGVVLDPR